MASASQKLLLQKLCRQSRIKMKIVFFDGYCNLCNGTIDWLMSHDLQETLRYASLQGETAKTMLPPLLAANDPAVLDSVIYLRHGRLYERSSAALMLLQDIGGPWKLTYPLIFIPRFFRDIVYTFIAKNRYRFFGKRDTCRTPAAHERAFFLP